MPNIRLVPGENLSFRLLLQQTADHIWSSCLAIWTSIISQKAIFPTPDPLTVRRRSHIVACVVGVIVQRLIITFPCSRLLAPVIYGIPSQCHCIDQELSPVLNIVQSHPSNGTTPNPPVSQTESHPQYILQFHPETSHNANYQRIDIKTNLQ